MKKFVSVAAIITGLTSCMLSIFIPVVAMAAVPITQTPNAGQALEIAPPVITLSGNPGQVITAQISLRNISSSNLLVTGQINDFVAAGEDGTPKIILDSDPNNPYSFKSWVSPLVSTLMVPRQIKSIPVIFTVPTNATPGGHYGVIRFSATPPELKGTGVSLSASLGSLVLFNVTGKISDKLTIATFTASQGSKTGSLFESGPVTFTERMQNSGNTQELPTGQVSVTDMFGKKIAGVSVNVPPKNVLPSSIRKFSQNLDSTVIGDRRLFGHYTAVLTVTYGSNKKVATSILSFWVIPYRLIGIVLVVLVGGFFLIRFLMQRYNRRIISNSQRSRRR